MVDDFLRWPLPDSVCADSCTTKQGLGRVGTNLLTAVEAKAMFEAIVLPKLAELEAANARQAAALATLPVDKITRAALEAIRDDAPSAPSVQTLFGRNLAKALTT